MYILFTDSDKNVNQQKFDSWNQLAAATFSYPNDTGTAQYSQPIYHPNGIHMAMPILSSTIQHVENDPNNQLFILEQLGIPTFAAVLPPDWVTPSTTPGG